MTLPLASSPDQHDSCGSNCSCSPGATSDSSASFVRRARLEDLEALGRVHAASMRASLEQAHQEAHGTPLPSGVAAMIAAPVLQAGWEGAVAQPPSPAHHVLVATQDGEVVGLIALAPSVGKLAADEASSGEEMRGSVDDSEERAAEVTALGVHPDFQRKGHGSRLLAAAADMARADGATVLLAWAVRGDASIEALLGAAGLERTRSHRLLPVGNGVTEDCWAAALS